MSSVLTAAILRALTPTLIMAAKSAGNRLQQNFTNWKNEKSHAEIAEKILRTGTVKTIWSNGKDTHIHDFYYPSKIQESGNPKLIDDISQLPPGNLVIEGIVGQGKSIFMRHIACSTARMTKNNTIPVFIELQKVDAQNTIQHAILQNLGHLGLNADEASFRHLAKEGFLTLILDGFDEIAESYAKKALDELDFLQYQYPKTKIIVSSRPDSGIQMQVGFSIFKLQPLESHDYAPFLERLNLDIVRKQNIISAISSSSGEIKELISTPLMLTLVVWVYESEQEIPSTLKLFFEKLFHVVFTRHDSLKSRFSRKHHSGLSEANLQMLFEAFCFMTVQNGFGRSMNNRNFGKAFKEALKYTEGCECKAEDFKYDIVKVACLMLEEGLDLITFLHKSILDYFAAAFIIHNEEDLAEAFYDQALQNYSTWRHVLFFLKDADQYKYAKYYILKHYPSHLKTLETILKTDNTKSLANELKLFFGDFRSTINAQHTIVAYRHSHSIDTDFSSDITKAVSETFLSKSIDEQNERLRGNVDLDRYLPATSYVDSERNCTLLETIESIGEEKIRSAIQELELSYLVEFSKAEKLVASQAKKRLIFEDNPKNKK